MVNLRQGNADLEREMVNLRQGNADLEREMANLRQKNTDLEREMVNLRQRNAELENAKLPKLLSYLQHQGAREILERIRCSDEPRDLLELGISLLGLRAGLPTVQYNHHHQLGVSYLLESSSSS